MTSKKTEVAIIEQPKLDALIKESGIELTKAEAHVKAFHSSLADLSEWSRPLASLNKENPTSEDSAKAREARLKIVKIRTGAEEIKDERKKLLLTESNLIQSAYNLVKDACALTESQYDEIEKHQARLEAERKQQLKTDRLALLIQYGSEEDFKFFAIEDMSEEVFNQFLDTQKIAFNTRKEQAEKAEAERIEAERLAEEKRIADELAEKERIEAQRVENERLRKEAEEKEKALQKEREATKKLQDQKDAELAKEREESQRLQAELKAKQDAIDLAEQQEKQRIEAEEAEKIAYEKAAPLAPDVDKLRKLYADIKAIQMPEVQTDEAKQAISEIKEGLSLILTGIETAAKKFK